MNSLDQVLRETLQERAAAIPVPADLTSRVIAEGRRRARRSAVALTGLAAVAVLGVGITAAAVVAGGGLPATVSPGGATGAPAPHEHEPLVTTGECAGLTVTFGDASQGDPANPPPVPDDVQALRAGDGNRVQMARQDLKWLRASGPCADRLILRTPGELVFGNQSRFADGVLGQADRVAVLFTNTGSDGTDTFELGLWAWCGTDSDCSGLVPLATVTVDVIGTTDLPSGAVVTSTP